MKDLKAPMLKCPACDSKGLIIMPESLPMPQLGAEMSFPHFHCPACSFDWYSAKDVIALVVAYKYEVRDRSKPA